MSIERLNLALTMIKTRTVATSNHVVSAGLILLGVDADTAEVKFAGSMIFFLKNPNEINM